MGNWDMVRLGDVFLSIKNGANIKQGDDECSGYPITRIETISDGRINRSKMGYAGIDNITPYKDNILESGDILMSHINSVKHLGKTALYAKENGEEIIHGMNLLRLRPSHQQIDSKYAKYFFDTYDFKKQIPRITKNSVNQSSFNVKALQALTIPLPPLEVQQQIADALDRASALIEKRKAQIAKLDLLVKSQFVEMFEGKGFPYTSLIEIIQEGAGLSYGIVQPGDDGTGSMGVLRPVDFADGQVLSSNIKYIDRLIGDSYRRTELTGEELLITVRGTTGITALSDRRFKGMNVTRGIAVIRYDIKKVNPFYLNEYFRTGESQYYIQDKTRGATLQQINLSDLRIQPILNPPLDLQNAFADFVRQTDKSKFVMQQSLSQLERNYKSLSQKCFCGEIF